MTKLNKFFPTTEEVQAAVIWVDDVEVSIKESGYTDTMDELMDRVMAGDLKVPGYVHVIDDSIELATQMATALDAQYEKEMKLMKDATKAIDEVNTVVENTNTKGEKTMKVTKVTKGKSNARKFLDATGADMANAKQAPKQEETKSETTKEEKEMKKTTMGGRRRKLGNGAGQGQVEETVVENQTKEEEVVEVKQEKKETPRRRKSSGNQSVDAKQARAPKKKLGRQESMHGQSRQKHEGNWYTNKGRFDVLNRFEDIIENLAEGNYVDQELGIETIVFVEPSELYRYQNREDINVVIQIKANGNVLEFPIKDASVQSNSDLSCSTIGWVPTQRGGLRPAFGHYRPNALQVKAKCACGNEFSANTGNMYCGKCKTRHDDVEISGDHNLDFDFETNWVFETNPSLVVPQETLALVMALAQYDADLDMEGLLSE
jgi:hypothetical protein